MTDFSTRLLAWFDQHGRMDLPWQRDPTPYRVWLSEIMLQQTQVKTVIPYYLRFLERFPSLRVLADAPLDEVLHHWSGLGYYARARNLHKAAQMVRDAYQGMLPTTFEAMQSLPGIGRSTAGAILAFAANQRHPILDGNVKRVLTRYHAIAGWPGQPAIEQQLWELAERYTPAERVADYTQAMMDLGATLCTRTRPQCLSCPLAADCQAKQTGNPMAYPSKKPSKSLPTRQTRFLILRNTAGEILLEQRPPAGIWGGLWGFPESSVTDGDENLEDWCQQRLGLTLMELRPGTVLRHTFSHFHLDIQPLYGTVADCSTTLLEPGKLLWYNPRRPAPIGLAAPVAKLLQTIPSL